MSSVLGSNISLCAAATLGFLASSAPSARATEMTAGVVMEKMDTVERASYIQGIIEGLAYARYARDNEHLPGDQKTVEGMKCVYSWFYDSPGRFDLIYAAFGKFPTYPPGAIIGNLVKKSCGD